MDIFHNDIITITMETNFWQRVIMLMDNQNISRKELAIDVGFDVSNIGKGLLNNNIPAADTAVKIAKVLNTTAEYLVTGLIPQDEKHPEINMDEFNRYSKLVHYLDALPKLSRIPIEHLINELYDRYTNNQDDNL